MHENYFRCEGILTWNWIFSWKSITLLCGFRNCDVHLPHLRSIHLGTASREVSGTFSEFTVKFSAECSYGMLTLRWCHCSLTLNQISGNKNNIVWTMSHDTFIYSTIYSIIRGWWRKCSSLLTLYSPAMISLFHLAMIMPTLTSVPFNVVGNIIPSLTVDISEVSPGASVVVGCSSCSSSSSSSLILWNWENISEGVV